MTAEARPISVTSLGHSKMEDRKRAAIKDPDDAVQPPKKTARVVNGVKNEDAPEWEPMVQVRLKPPCHTMHIDRRLTCFTNFRSSKKTQYYGPLRRQRRKNSLWRLK